MDSDSETEESKPPPSSIKYKEALDMLKCFTWLHQPEAIPHNTSILFHCMNLLHQKSFILHTQFNLLCDSY